MQWAGEEYLLEELLAQAGSKIPKDGQTISTEVLYWTGYIYRYWHFYKDIPSKKIYHLANLRTMQRNYLMFHTMDPELAIDDLIEINAQKR
jgi:hypothetical protein